ncbi:uncharacterized protein [Branchiostoma lanceolatum]|uniref:uncharacterized protein n=1 Tax=Branchiostoma lanceolatum TaxID=7740 RepID=UPI00345634A0
MDVNSLANKLQDLELFIKSYKGSQVGYGRALIRAIVTSDHVIEVEVLKSIGDLYLKKGKLRNDSTEFCKATGLYAAALLRCTDPDMGQTLEHRIGYAEKLYRQLLGYTPQRFSTDDWGTSNNVLRVADICYKLDRSVGKSCRSLDDTFTEALVTAIADGDVLLEVEALKSLGDLYLRKGKATSDVSQYSKAAAMYNKALTRCEDSETKQTLYHRIKYMDKIKKTVPKHSSPRKSAKRGRRAVGKQSGNKTRTGKIQDSHLQAGVTGKYKDLLTEGESSFARVDLDSAEQHFAAALKTVHVRDPTAQQYQREVEPLCKLGDVYSKRGQQTGDGGDFVKAAALYNAAIARSEDQVLNGKIDTDIRDLHSLFIKYVLNINDNVNEDETEIHKKQLKEMRDQIKLEMETIDQQLDPYVHDEDDPCVKEIEAKRAQAIRHVFENIAQQRKEFISLLVEECIGLMGPPPCKYALIGLGSQATALVTPYSDLEFAILVEDECEQCLVYFRNLTHYLHLKVVNLGETILPALGIKSLNNFCSENPLDDWYYDSVTPRGFAFDGSMSKASKTPLGRQGTMGEPPKELICTPESLVSVLQKDATSYLKEGYHLATILRNPCLIAGEQDLIDAYMAITMKILQANGGEMSKQLALQTLKDNIETHQDEEVMKPLMIDVKKEIYRFPSVAVDCLAILGHIAPTTIWKTIEEMKNQNVISPNNAHHLTVLTSISAELRLRTYIANGGQKENLSALASMGTTLLGRESSLQTNNDIQTNALYPVFHISKEKELFRYYYTAVPFRSFLTECSGKPPILDSLSDLYDNSQKVRGMMYFNLCRYSQAVSCYREALQKVEDITEKIDILCNLGNACLMASDYQKAISAE